MCFLNKRAGLDCACTMANGMIVIVSLSSAVRAKRREHSRGRIPTRRLLRSGGLDWRSGYTQDNPAFAHCVHKTALSHLTLRRLHAVQLRDMEMGQVYLAMSVWNTSAIMCHCVIFKPSAAQRILSPGGGLTVAGSEGFISSG